MNTPIPPPPPNPTPQTAPTVGGLLQAAVTAWGAWRIGRWAGLGPDAALALAGSIASAITSGLHTLAQRVHWLR
jgi:hypothetical protein